MSSAARAFCSTTSTVPPAARKRDDLRHDAVDDERRQAERRLVEQEEAGPRHERAGDRHHLLLAARERLGQLMAALAQHRELLVLLLERLGDGGAVGLGVGAHPQIFFDGHGAEQLAPLRHLGEARAHDGRRGQAADGAAVIADCAARRRHQAHHGVEQGRLAGAVGADQRDDLAGRDGQRYLAQHRRAAIAARHALELKQRAHAPPGPDRRR